MSKQTHKITVNIDGVRKNAARAYNSLCRKLNENLSAGQVIHIDAEDIEQDMANLRIFLIGICCLYVEGDPKFTDVSEGIEFEVFNDEDEQHGKEGGV